MQTTLIEYTNTLTDNLVIDEKDGVIHGIKIVGLESKNGRVYPEETLKKAVTLYENVKVNINHPDAQNGNMRKYQDRVGSIKNIRFMPKEGLYADFYFNPKHILAEQFLWDAKNRPENLGMSHNVEAKVSNQNNKQIVDEIICVRSVDIVADPATTNGLFESLQDKLSFENNWDIDENNNKKSIKIVNNKNSCNKNNMQTSKNIEETSHTNNIEKTLSLILEQVIHCNEERKNNYPIYSLQFIKTLLKLKDDQLVECLLQERYDYYKKIASTKISEEIQSTPTYLINQNNDNESFLNSIKK